MYMAMLRDERLRRIAAVPKDHATGIQRNADIFGLISDSRSFQFFYLDSRSIVSHIRLTKDINEYTLNVDFCLTSTNP